MAESSDPTAAAAAAGAGVGLSLEQLHARHGGRLTRALVRVSIGLHAVAGLTMVALLLWTVGDIVARSAFSRPFRGTVELTELAVVMLVYLGLARAESQDAHIAVDLFYVRLSERLQLVLRVVAGVVTLVVIAALTWRLQQFAGQLDTGGYTTMVWRLPLYPVAILGVLGAGAFGLAVLANTLVALRALVGRR